MRDEQRRPQQTLCATNKCPIVSQYQTLTFNVCARLIREHMSMIKILKPSLDLFWSSKLQSARKNQRVHINNNQQNHRQWAQNSHPVTRGLTIVVGLKTSPWLRVHSLLQSTLPTSAIQYIDERRATNAIWWSDAVLTAASRLAVIDERTRERCLGASFAQSSREIYLDCSSI